MNRQTRMCFLQQIDESQVSWLYVFYFAKWTICIYLVIKLVYSLGKYDSHSNSKETCTITVLHNTFRRTVLTRKSLTFKQIHVYNALSLQNKQKTKPKKNQNPKQ